MEDATAPSKPNVFALTKTEGHGSTFNLAMADNTSFQDFDLRVKVKAVTGEEDQGGGPIWRCKDKNNYYICRFNPLEGNYCVYEVVNGQRKQLETAKIETKPGEWYSVRVTMVEDQIICYLDGKKLLDATSDTFKDAGTIGLWTRPTLRRTLMTWSSFPTRNSKVKTRRNPKTASQLVLGVPM
jgi:hypothetical protein